MSSTHISTHSVRYVALLQCLNRVRHCNIFKNILKRKQMSVKYSLALMSSKPGDKKAPKLYYAKSQTDGVVEMDDMADEIAYATSLTDGDVLNVLRALIRQLRMQLAAGKCVHMENLGNFQLQLSSKGAATEKEFNASNIRAARIQFRPGKMMKPTTRAEALEFVKVKAISKLKINKPTTDENKPDKPHNGEGEAPDPLT